MPLPGLSLVGFMQRQQAHGHLLNQCTPNSADPAALDTEWAAAKERLGGTIANAGHPDVRPIPAPYDAHVQQLITTPWCAPAFAGRFRGCEFKLVELDPLLEHQFTVSTSRALKHRAELAKPSTMQQMLDFCLPLKQSQSNFSNR